MPKTPLALLVLLFLAGCQGSSTRSVVERAALANIPESLKVACPDVVDIPHRGLSAGEAARLWARDRTSLGDCRARHVALSEALAAIEGQGRTGGGEGSQ